MSNSIDITQTANEMVFNFKGNELTTITDDNGDPWFVARQVADLLGYKNISRDIHRHCKSLKMLKSTDSVSLDVPSRGLIIIPERDVYRLVMRSNMPEAEEFEEWVVGEVLPSIRKHGGYVVGQNEMSDDELLARAVLHAQSVIEEKNTLIAKQNEKIEEDSPKVEYYEAVGNSSGYKSISESIKLMNIGNLGRNKAMALLRTMKILQSSNTYWNQPYQHYINQGYFVMKQTVIPTGSTVSVTLVTPKGHQWLYKKLSQ